MSHFRLAKIKVLMAHHCFNEVNMEIMLIDLSSGLSYH